MKQTYIEKKDLATKVRTLVREFVGIQKAIKEAQKEIRAKREAQEPYKKVLIEFLKKFKIQGILLETELVYLQESTKAPSFKQVLDAVEIPKTLRAKLEKAYEELTKPNGTCLKLKNREDV